MDNIHLPDSHAKQKPCLILLVSLDGAKAPKGQEQIGLHDLNGFIALRGDGKGKFFGHLR